MGKYLLIVNGGSCSRDLLCILGATTKRDSLFDLTQRGFYGSGSKIAPVAACRLGIEMHISSYDERGRYFFSYETEDRMIDGKLRKLVVRRLDFKDTTPTWMTTDAFPSWPTPIGCDHIKSFRVFREPILNAKDADPRAPRFMWSDTPLAARPGYTVVSLSATDEIRYMMEHFDRYFKFLSDAKPHFAVPGIGEIYPKSEAGVTRMFSLGTLAYCSNADDAATLFDYSFDKKELASEERVFKDIGDVHKQLGKLLAAVDDPLLAQGLLCAMDAGTARKEITGLAYVGSTDPIPGAAAWLQAWKSALGEDAVLSSDHQSDEAVRVIHGRPVYDPKSQHLKDFLRRCGVQESYDIVPKGNDYRVVEPTAEEAKRLAYIRSKHLLLFPESADIEEYVFEPLSEEKRKHIAFTEWTKGRLGRKFYYQRGVAFTDNPKLLIARDHEYRHIRSQAADITQRFELFADSEIEELLVRLLDVEDDRPPKTTKTEPPKVIVDEDILSDTDVIFTDE